MSNMYNLKKVDWNFEGSLRVRESSKTSGARRTVSNITTNTIAAKVKSESFFFFLYNQVIFVLFDMI